MHTLSLAELVKRAIDNSGCKSANGLAKRLGVSHVAVGSWIAGEQCPHLETLAELAELAGMDPWPTAALVREQSPQGVKHRRLLRRLARVAAFFPLIVSSFATDPAARAELSSSSHNQRIVYIMSRFRYHLARMLQSAKKGKTEPRRWNRLPVAQLDA